MPASSFLGMLASLRFGALTAAVGKLTGLLRVASFIGLGLVLIGLGTLHRRYFVQRPRTDAALREAASSRFADPYFKRGDPLFRSLRIASESPLLFREEAAHLVQLCC